MGRRLPPLAVVRRSMGIGPYILPSLTLTFDVKRPQIRVLRGAAEFFLDAEQLVIFGNALTAVGRRS